MASKIAEELARVTGGSLTVSILLLASVLGIAVWSVKTIVRQSQIKDFKAENECEPLLAHFPTKWLGINFIQKTAQEFKANRYLHSLTEQYETLGYTHEVKALGGTSVWTIEPENIKTMLSVKFKDYSLGDRPVVMGPLLGRGVFVTDGAEWSHSRALLRPNFAKDQIADLEMIESHLEHLLRLIHGNNETIDLQPLLLRFTMDSSTEFLFGESTNTLTTSENFEFTKAFNYSLEDIAEGLRMGPWAKYRRSDPEAVKSHKICREYVDRYVNQALEYRTHAEKQGVEAFVQDKRRTFLRELALATSDREKLRDELLSLLLAGRNTTASLVGSLLFALARNPETWLKVREEAATVLQGKLPTYTQLRDLKYAKYCVNEVLRLWPPVPNNAKQALRDTVLPVGGGPDGKSPIFVPKGCPVIYTVFAMHRRKDLFGEDADEFTPERWEKQKYLWEYLPFNGGPRVCLGQQYAITEALYVLVRFAQEFQTLESRDQMPWTEDLSLTVSSKNGVKVALCR